MKEKRDARLSEPLEETKEEQQEAAARKMSLGVFALVLVLFLAVISVTEIISSFAGKHWGTAALVLMAVIIAGLLYRKEIKARIFKRK